MNISVIGLLPDSFNKQYYNLAQEISKRYQVFDALNWPPHISIGKGFNNIKKPEVAPLLDEYELFAKNLNRVTISINDFQFADNAKLTDTIRSQYAVVLKVEKTAPLIELNKKLRAFNSSTGSNSTYVPHITLAYNDLNKDQYFRIKEYLNDKTFKTETFIKSIALTDNKGLGYKREILKEIQLS